MTTDEDIWDDIDACESNMKEIISEIKWALCLVLFISAVTTYVVHDALNGGYICIFFVVAELALLIIVLLYAAIRNVVDYFRRKKERKRLASLLLVCRLAGGELP